MCGTIVWLTCDCAIKHAMSDNCPNYESKTDESCIFSPLKYIK